MAPFRSMIQDRIATQSAGIVHVCLFWEPLPTIIDFTASTRILFTRSDFLVLVSFAEGLFVAATSPLNVLFFGNRNVAGKGLYYMTDPIGSSPSLSFLILHPCAPCFLELQATFSTARSFWGMPRRTSCAFSPRSPGIRMPRCDKLVFRTSRSERTKRNLTRLTPPMPFASHHLNPALDALVVTPIRYTSSIASWSMAKWSGTCCQTTALSVWLPGAFVAVHRCYYPVCVSQACNAF